MTPVHFIVPEGIDDPTRPSGGNTYDRRVCDLLSRDRDLVEIAVPGDWPAPGTVARQALARALTDIPDTSTVLLETTASSECGTSTSKAVTCVSQ